MTTIKEKTIIISPRGVEAEYYKKMGYEIPTYADINGVMRIKRGTKITVKVDHLPP